MPPKPAIKPRKKVPCHCDECNGKLVDPRTKVKHEAEYEQMNRSSRSTKISKPVSKRVQVDNNDDETSNASSSSSGSSSSSSTSESQGPIHIPTKRERKEKFKAVESAVNDELIGELYNEDTDFSSPIDDDQSEDLNDETSDDERFAAPELEDFGDNEGFMCPDSDVEFSESWILIWIFKYQSRFRLSEVAISSLIGFFSQVLKDADSKRFANFPSSSYSAKKLLRIDKATKTYAVCPKCNNLYKIGEILGQNEQVTEASPGLKCSQVEFPKHPMKKHREACGEELLKNVPVNNGYIKRPRIVFPMPDLKTQIFTMYQRPNFEQNLAKWANRHINGDILADIYDGEVWKTFKSDDNLFFTPELADSNLGIMINLDWFQPFDRTIYSTGVIYGVICNLPREIRFRQENMLILGLLPGPHEVHADNINHFLSPIVTELLEFWTGVIIKTPNNPTGKTVRMAIICCSSDIPAARKLCGHISALAACHRCYKRANNGNFGNFDDMTDWFKPRDLEDFRQNAIAWRNCKTKDERNQHVSNNLVRWTELLRLPYFNPIRHCVVDPMHNLFLGIASWIVKRLWIDGGKISKDDLKIMEKRAEAIKLPADMGRIPNKISTGEGFSGFTADQWKTFILVYSTPIMWDLLSVNDREILGNFVRACSLLVCRIINTNEINEAHNRLLKIGKLIEEHYGENLITPNIHLSLHIAECCRDYGPIYSFWCYSFERMNGILGKYFNNECFGF